MGCPKGRRRVVGLREGAAGGRQREADGAAGLPLLEVHACNSTWCPPNVDLTTMHISDGRGEFLHSTYTLTLKFIRIAWS
jgi:hypothetical protein